MTLSKLNSLSIIIPVFNEEKTVSIVLDAVEKLDTKGFEKEILVIDDGSTDGTLALVNEKAKKNKKIRVIAHKINKGKGAAVRSGIEKASGDYIVIQDADLEYNPRDILQMVRAIKNVGKDVIYGTRLKRLPHFSGEERTFRFFLHYIGNRFLSLTTSILYGVWITDMETCYKLFPRQTMRNITLRARGFELEPELTAKLLKKGLQIIEVPIETKPRGYDEGKKLNTFSDGFKAVWALIKYRFTD